jgi:hypothetical protein
MSDGDSSITYSEGWRSEPAQTSGVSTSAGKPAGRESRKGSVGSVSFSLSTYVLRLGIQSMEAGVVLVRAIVDRERERNEISDGGKKGSIYRAQLNRRLEGSYYACYSVQFIHED